MKKLQRRSTGVLVRLKVAEIVTKLSKLGLDLVLRVFKPASTKLAIFANFNQRL